MIIGYWADVRFLTDLEVPGQIPTENQQLLDYKWCNITRTYLLYNTFFI